MNERVFQQCLSTQMVYLQDVAPCFALYFATYAARVTEWANCYRKGTQAITNMYVESFHDVLKTAYMERKANRRIDTVKYAAQEAHDKAFQRLIKVEKKRTARNSAK
jgi:hypothetical protein